MFNVGIFIKNAIQLFNENISSNDIYNNSLNKEVNMTNQNNINQMNFFGNLDVMNNINSIIYII